MRFSGIQGAGKLWMVCTGGAETSCSEECTDKLYLVYVCVRGGRAAVDKGCRGKVWKRGQLQIMGAEARGVKGNCP